MVLKKLANIGGYVPLMVCHKDPFMFLLYDNDLCNVSNVLKPILFVDDINLFFDVDDYVSFTKLKTNKPLLILKLYFRHQIFWIIEWIIEWIIQ